MKRYLIFALILIVIIGVLAAPKILGDKEQNVKFKELEEEEIPEKITEMLPKYIMEERALISKYRDDIYVIVTRGEKKSQGFDVDIEKIVKEKHSKDKFDIVVYANFTDPKVDEILPQEYDYPFVIVKTKLKSMPEEVHLEFEYEN
ncbi:MAG TPA: protease complex subunit PrcB family protein [Tissierellaceae bacterium]|nr:protease complex subunit PrcB family protein [Tissierellaceae bacterium]